MMATECPREVSVTARVVPTRPAPMITKCTATTLHVRIPGGARYPPRQRVPGASGWGGGLPRLRSARRACVPPATPASGLGADAYHVRVPCIPHATERPGGGRPAPTDPIGHLLPPTRTP